MSWFGCIDTLSNWLGQPLYHGFYPGIGFWLERPPFSFCPETALIPTALLPSLDLPCPHKSAPPGPFPSNLDLTRTHWSQTCSLNVPADVHTEAGPWTMVQKKICYQWSTSQKNRETVGVASQILFGTPSPTSGTWISHVVYAKQNVR